MLNIGVLTSSRADYGIYLPLLKKIQADNFFALEIIAFGTHLSKFHGYTLSEIMEGNYPKVHTISALLSNDSENAISTAYALTALKFSDFWEQNNFDIVLCLGDRFEMSAAVQAGIPFNIKFAHIHGGETTLGAIDNIYRHQISLAASLHFTAGKEFSQRIEKLIGTSRNIFTVGSLSLDDLLNFPLLSEKNFREKFKIENEFVLITFHPETVSSKENIHHANAIKKGLGELGKHIHLVVTLPNADTSGTIFREALQELKVNNFNGITLIENFGKTNYFSAMKYAKFMLGNTSSGIIEAASFNKYVINVGDRQKGRSQSKNTVNISFDAVEILQKSIDFLKLGEFHGENIYFKEKAADSIVNKLKKYAEL
jgi:GDP/UDP-N,N'-diacetylbacillosamine 2-epimerase (hydrolysing)